MIRAAEIVGRERELARIDTFLDERVGALVLEGEPGVGKTTLWRAGVERARERGFHLLEASPAEPERELSFAGLGDLLADVHDQIGGLPAPQRRALRVALLLDEPRGTPPDGRAIGTALTSLLKSLAERQVLVSVDDVQWLDEPTLSALQFALRRAPVAVLLARRRDTLGVTLETADVVDVSPFVLESLDDLLRFHLNTVFLRPTLLEIMRVSGGNPFFALEIARALVALPDPPGPTDPLPVPDDLRDLVAARLERLPAAARASALLAAAAARPTRSLLERAGADGVAELLASRVLVRDGDRIRFAHPLLATTAYSSAHADERRAAHRRLAAAAVDPEERGHHLAAAAASPDAEVATAIDAAAAHARARGATDAAGRLAARAVELTPVDDGVALQRRRLAEADAWVAAGAMERARLVLAEALEQASGRERREVLATIAYLAANIEGASERALDVATTGLAELEPEDADLRVKLELARGTALRNLQRYDDALQASRAAVDAAEAAGDPGLLSRALGAQFFGELESGLGENLTLIRRAIELSDESTPGHVWAQEHYAGYLTLTYQFDSAREIYLRLAARMRALGDADEAYVLLLLGWNEFWACRYTEAERYADDTLKVSRQTGRPAFELGALYLTTFIQIFRGDLADAATTLEELRRTGEAVDAENTAGAVADALALTAFVRGRFDEAAEQFAASESYFATKDPAMRPHVAARAEALVAVGRLAEAQQLLDPYEALARALGRSVHLAGALRARALLLAARHEDARGQATFEEALAEHDRLEAPFERARTLLAYGSFQRRRRKRASAGQLLAQALALFDGIGARAWANRTQVELAHLGGRPARAGSLTPAEQQIAELVASGLSNVQVANALSLSARTVEWNLSKIYRKLGVRSRTELAATFAARSARG